MGVFDIVMEKPAEVSRGDGCVWQSLQNLMKSVSTMVVFDIVMENLLKSVEAIGVFDIVMEKPAEVSRSGVCLI